MTLDILLEDESDRITFKNIKAVNLPSYLCFESLIGTNIIFSKFVREEKYRHMLDDARNWQKMKNGELELSKNGMENINKEMLEWLKSEYYASDVLCKRQDIFFKINEYGYRLIGIPEEKWKKEYESEFKNAKIGRKNDEFYQKYFSELKKGVCFDFGRKKYFLLTALTPVKTNILPNRLKHMSSNKSALEEFKKTKLWGCSEKNYPTYIQLDSSDLVRSDDNENITLSIKTDRLLEKRKVYIDPESFAVRYLYEFGQSYLILGGLPEEAIRYVEVKL